MNNKKSKIFLLYLTIIFFVFASLISNVYGDIGNNNTIFINNATNNPHSQGDGLLAYWSFNEGNGNIAYDSSGNNYNGIIYGAKWTSGQSSYALDFDGFNDYIKLDSYSNDLGFNKTDDYKISVWINSISSESGIIYGIGDEIDFIPRVYLELNDDGTLEFKVQSTDWCDITFRTNESYNDGIWHYIEGIYLGGSSNPIINLYVDNEFVGSKSAWLCPMNSNQFNTAKIGVRSYDEEKYFNGLIDEVKIFKKPNGNQAPDAPLISGPSSGTIGEEYYYSFIGTDPDGEDIYFFIDWGDETNTGWIGPYSSNEEINIGHTWYINNTYEIKARVRDTFDVGNWSNYLIAMGNVAPYKPSITGVEFCKKDTLYDFTFVTTDLNEHDVKYFIDWGDGETEWTDYYPSGVEATVSHKWSNQGIYYVRVKAKDIYESESIFSESFEVKITQKAFLFGFIKDKISDVQVTTFNARFLIYFSLFPIKLEFLSSNEKIIVLNDYNGVLNDIYILGAFYSLVI